MSENAQNTETATKRSSKLMLGHSLGWWNGATLIALFCAAASAVAIMLTQYATIRLQTQEANDANLRIASLQKEGADARLEQERLKASFAWRTLGPGQADIFNRVLAMHPGSVNLWYVLGDPESAFLAAQYARIIGAANWQVAAAGANFTGIAFGITLAKTETTDGQVLSAALQKAGIEFSASDLPEPVFTSGATKIKEAPVLLIGSKRPAVYP